MLKLTELLHSCGNSPEVLAVWPHGLPHNSKLENSDRDGELRVRRASAPSPKHRQNLAKQKQEHKAQRGKPGLRTSVPLATYASTRTTLFNLCVNVATCSTALPLLLYLVISQLQKQLRVSQQPTESMELASFQ